MAVKGEIVVDQWLTDDGLLLLAAYARDGMTNQEIADKIGVAKKTLTLWIRNYPEIREAINTSKELVDYKVENALLKAALGYSVKETKVVMKLRQGRMTAVEQEQVIKEVQPDVRAITLWLNNRQTKKWRRNADSTLDNELEDGNNITVNIIRHGSKKQIENQTDNDDWETDEDWEEEESTEPNKSVSDESSNDIEININVNEEPEDDDWDDDDWDAEPIEVEPINVEKNLQVKNTDLGWKEKGVYNHNGVKKKLKKGSTSFNELIEKTNSLIEEEDLDED